MALPDGGVGLPEHLFACGILQADGLCTVGVHGQGQEFVVNGCLHFQYLLCPSYFPGSAVSSILPRVPKIKSLPMLAQIVTGQKASPDRGKPLFGSTISMLCLLQQGCTSGRVTTKVVPFSLLLSTVTPPPCSTAISRTRASPSPTPPISRLRDLSTRKKGLEKCCPGSLRGCPGRYLQRAARQFAFPAAG